MHPTSCRSKSDSILADGVNSRLYRALVEAGARDRRAVLQLHAPRPYRCCRGDARLRQVARGAGEGDQGAVAEVVAKGVSDEEVSARSSRSSRGHPQPRWHLQLRLQPRRVGRFDELEVVPDLRRQYEGREAADVKRVAGLLLPEPAHVVLASDCREDGVVPNEPRRGGTSRPRRG